MVLPQGESEVRGDTLTAERVEELMNGVISDVLIEFDRAGSLPTTHESQGSDMGLFGGLLGWEADDERLPNSAQALADAHNKNKA